MPYIINNSNCSSLNNQPLSVQESRSWWNNQPIKVQETKSEGSDVNNIIILICPSGKKVCFGMSSICVTKFLNRLIPNILLIKIASATRSQNPTIRTLKTRLFLIQNWGPNFWNNGTIQSHWFYTNISYICVIDQNIQITIPDNHLSITTDYWLYPCKYSFTINTIYSNLKDWLWNKMR